MLNNDWHLQCCPGHSILLINTHCLSFPLRSLLTTNVNMPYPQYTFAQRSQSTSVTQPTSEKHTMIRAHWSDRTDPTALETAELSHKKHSDRVSTASSRPILNKFQTALQGTSLSSTSTWKQPVDTHPASPPPEMENPLSRHPPSYTYKCTLCWKENKPPCYTIGPESRIVCLDCWRWVHSVSVCWKCNEVIFRKEDAISFGWC